MSGYSTSVPLRIKIKKDSKKHIESKLNAIYPNSDLSSRELDYDLNILPEYESSILIEESNPSIDRIAKLPDTSFTNISIFNKCAEDAIEESNQEYLENDLCDIGDDMCDNADDNVEDNVDDSIDKDALEKETIGNKTYYLDYSKGIIYDLTYRIIGNIDEYGEINIY